MSTTSSSPTPPPLPSSSSSSYPTSPITTASTTTSLSSLTLSHVYEHGRRYHAYRDGAYPLPDDEQEQRRLEALHAVFMAAAGGRLVWAPLRAPVPPAKDEEDVGGGGCGVTVGDGRGQGKHDSFYGGWIGPLQRRGEVGRGRPGKGIQEEDEGDGKKTLRVLDLGTGTGAWAIAFAEQREDSEVLGCDLSPIQPRWVPRNVRFEVDDCEDEWAYGCFSRPSSSSSPPSSSSSSSSSSAYAFSENRGFNASASEERRSAPTAPFDLIHLRCLGGGIADWARLLQQAYAHLSPGDGWIECQELEMRFFVHEPSSSSTSTSTPTPSHATHPSLRRPSRRRPSVKPTKAPQPKTPQPRSSHGSSATAAAAAASRAYPALAHLQRLLRAASLCAGKEWDVAPRLSRLLHAAGYTDVTQEIRKIPIGAWHAHAHLRALGHQGLALLEQSLEAYALRLLTAQMGYSASEVRALVQRVRGELRRGVLLSEGERGGRGGLYWRVWFVWGRRPGEGPMF